MVTSADSIEAWIDYAERCLHGLAHDLRRVPFGEKTQRMHVHALELKGRVSRWLVEKPDVATRTKTLDEIEELASDARQWRAPT